MIEPATDRGGRGGSRHPEQRGASRREIEGAVPGRAPRSEREPARGRASERSPRASSRRPPRRPAFDPDLDHGDHPIIIPRPEHCISRRDIDDDALRILYRLHAKGHRGYLVGGAVRDLMLGKQPKDFDIATDAKPPRLKRMFRNCRIIGRRFRLAHLHYAGDKIIEVATFRSSAENDAIERDGELIRRDNVYGTAGEDARRRDLTINGLFYDISDFSVIDYVGGVADLRDGVVRTINRPDHSFREDPVRMLRTIRHATRLGFEIDEETRRCLASEREEILKANSARLLEEFYKDLASGHSRVFFEALHRHRFLKLLVPELVKSFRRRGARAGKALFLESLERLDRLRSQGVEITHEVGIAAMLSPLILPVARTLETDIPPGAAAVEPFRDALEPAFGNLRVYRRDAERLWHILGAWPRLARAFASGTIPVALRRRRYYPQALHVLGILEEDSEELEDFVAHAHTLWTPSEEEEPESPRRNSRRRRGGGRRRPEAEGGGTPQAPAGAEGGSRRRRRRRRGGRRRRPTA